MSYTPSQIGALRRKEWLDGQMGDLFPLYVEQKQKTPKVKRKAGKPARTPPERVLHMREPSPPPAWSKSHADYEERMARYRVEMAVYQSWMGSFIGQEKADGNLYWGEQRLKATWLKDQASPYSSPKPMRKAVLRRRE